MKKGFTLVEVLVSFAILSFSLLVIFSSFTLMGNIKRSEVEYLYFESICKDIDKYYTKYKSSWNTVYFNSNDTVIYYDKNYMVTTNENDKTYILSFEYVENELIVSIYRMDKNRFIIEDLNYGGTRNES